MTQAFTESDLFSRLFARMRGFGTWFSRAGFGLLVIFAAGVALLATTFVGLMLAAAALLMRLAHSFSTRSTRKASASHDSGKQEPRVMNQSGEDALNARQTPDGWVVEPSAGS